MTVRIARALFICGICPGMFLHVNLSRGRRGGGREGERGSMLYKYTYIHTYICMYVCVCFYVSVCLCV